MHSSWRIIGFGKGCLRFMASIAPCFDSSLGIWLLSFQKQYWQLYRPSCALLPVELPCPGNWSRTVVFRARPFVCVHLRAFPHTPGLVRLTTRCPQAPEQSRFLHNCAIPDRGDVIGNNRSVKPVHILWLDKSISHPESKTLSGLSKSVGVHNQLRLRYFL